MLGPHPPTSTHLGVKSLLYRGKHGYPLPSKHLQQSHYTSIEEQTTGKAAIKQRVPLTVREGGVSGTVGDLQEELGLIAGAASLGTNLPYGSGSSSQRCRQCAQQ